MATRPAGTVTFLFTDVEGSTHLLQAHEREYAAILADQRRLVLAAARHFRGEEVDAHGEEAFVVFPRARDALAAAVSAQRALQGHPWPGGAEVRVRMGLHTGEPVSTETGYVGMDVHRAARICASGYGGQILLSEATRTLIGDELPPGVTLRDLGEHRLKDLIHPVRLFQVVAASLASEFPPLRSLSTLPHNLPLELTSFVGREREMADVVRLLEMSRLLTLTGPGGCGKTRLALHVAAEVLDRYPDGVWLVELAPLADAALIPQAIASALGIREQPGRPFLDTIAEYLQHRDVLLVIDNCEHLVTGCAHVMDTVLRACPNVHLLVTSREPVGVEGERIWPVPPLSSPDPARPEEVAAVHDYEAVRLFVERAQAVARTFSVGPHNARAVAEICHHLDGIPLAVELAAARVKVLSLEEIAARLDDRFRILTGGSRTALPRHQTLRAAMDWSHELLSEGERALFRRLSVFAGGFTLDAAEAVCAGAGVETQAIFGLLSQLVDRSLVVADVRAEVTRYRLLDTVRRYGLEKLIAAGEATTVRSRYRDWFLQLAERADAELHGPRQREFFALLETEHDNLRAAMDWSRVDPSAGDAGLRLAAALYWFWFTRGHLTEGRERLEHALGVDDVRSAARASALIAAGGLAGIQGDYRHAGRLAEAGCAIFRELGDDRNLALALTTVGYIARQQGDHEQAAALCSEAVAVARKMEHTWAMGLALYILGEVALFQGDHLRAETLLEESVATGREDRDSRATALAQLSLALVARQREDYARAQTLARESLAAFEDLNDRWSVAHALRTLALVHHAAGDYDLAHDEHVRALELYRALGDRWGVASSLRSVALAAHRKGELTRARQLCAESLRLFREAGDRRGTADALQTLGILERAGGQVAAATQAWQESLDLFWRAGDRLGTVQCLRLLAEIAVVRGDFPRAAQLFGTLQSVGAGLAIDPARHAPKEYERSIGEVRARMSPEAFQAALQKGLAMAAAEAVAYAREPDSV